MVVIPNASKWKLEPGVIYCDTSVGSREFHDKKIIRNRHGLRTELKKLPSGDFAFRCGHEAKSPFCAGEYGCYIGIERKTLSDLVGSLLKRRLEDKQIPDMLVDYTMAWILVEGEWRPASDDAIEQVVWRGPAKNPAIEIVRWAPSRCALTYSQLSKWLTRFDVQGKGNLHRWRVRDMNETAAFIAHHYGWWRKEWKKHHLEGITKMPAPMKALLRKPNDFERNMASLTHVGIEKMKRATRRFQSIIHAINAPMQDWQGVVGKAHGKQVFRNIRREYRG